MKFEEYLCKAIMNFHHRLPSRNFVQFLSLSVFLIAICLGSFIIIASHLIVVPINFEVDSPKISADTVIPFAIEVISVDPITRTIVMDWYPQLIVPCLPNPNLVADIYFDRGILDSSSPAFGVLPPYSPIYQFNLTAICHFETSISSAFRTTSKLLASELSLGFPGPAKSTLQNYPFDVYFAPFVLYAFNHDSGDYIPLNITRSFGEVVNFEVSLHTSGHIQDPPWLQFTLRVSRSKATRIFVVLVGITNWLTATAFLTISASTLIYKRHKIYSEMFVVPVGALFAFTTIRAAFPGAPSGFGATIDLFTILPVLVIMSLCSFFLLFVILFRRIVEIDGPVWSTRVELDESSTGAMCNGRFGSKVIRGIILSNIGVV